MYALGGKERVIYLSKKLTIKQQKFADEYIISGNATEAAIKAGYSEKTAYSIGHENLSKPEIQAFIAKRLKKEENKRIMDLEEAIAITSSIARGELQKGQSKKIDNLSGEVIKDITYTFTPGLEERQRSLEHIIRCHGGFVDRQEVDMDMNLKIEVDYGD